MKILLVDDDAELLSALAAVLAGVPGHQVLTAASGGEALAAAQNAGGVDLLITDVVMDPMDGFTLRQEIQRVAPGVSTVFISGYDLSGYAEQIGDASLLQKPIEPETLRELVQKEAAKRGPAPLPAGFAPKVSAPAVPAAPAPEAETGPHAVPAAFPVSKPSVPSAAPVAATPAAVPVAKPAAAVPVAKATPAATPVAAPKAAVPVAKPATPVAAPAAPKAVPAAATPAAPKAVPAATPAATPVAAPKAVPAAVPVAKATPAAAPAAAAPKAAVPVAKPATPVAAPAAPKAAVPVAAPKAAVPVAKPAAAVPVAAAAAPVAAPAPIPVMPTPGEAGSDELGLMGQTVGGYQVVAFLGNGRWGPVYAAVQTAINRPVGLKVLEPSKAADESLKQRFIADARAKANVQHSAILSVYEAGAAENWNYYTYEYVDGQSLTEMQAAGRQLEEPVVLKLLRTVAEGMLYFEKHTVPHTPLEPSDVYLGADGQTRLSNLASQMSDHQVSTAQELEAFGKAILGIMSPNVGVGPRTLAARCLPTHNAPLAGWEALLQGAKALEPKVVPVGAAKISAQDRAAQAAVEKARAAQKKAFLINIGAVAAMFITLGFVVWFFFFRGKERILDDQVHIPAGSFITGEGRTVQGNEFWIDKYEVTIAQYNEFVEWIKANPEKEHDYDHPLQPKQIHHKPAHWDIFYKNAKNLTTVHNVKITMNSPALGVAWWNAYAFAKWQGRELPTELEWERAARGTDGRIYPWGNENIPENANTAKEGSAPSSTWWQDVDDQTKDASPDGLHGLAGNVSEWTASWTPDNRYPIVKGGNFRQPLQPMNVQMKDPDGRPFEAYISPEEDWKQPLEELVGFRTISRKPPQ